MTDTDRERVQHLVQQLREVAGTASTQHSWWDLIGDGERLLHGSRSLLWDRDACGWCAHAELLLAAAAPWVSRR